MLEVIFQPPAEGEGMTRVPVAMIMEEDEDGVAWTTETVTVEVVWIEVVDMVMDMDVSAACTAMGDRAATRMTRELMSCIFALR